MDDQELRQALSELQERQKVIQEELKFSSGTRKDVWDKIHCIAPIVSGLLIGGFGAFIGYSYNQQQIKLQEAEALERFIPHLAGNERSKKAAILAMSSLTNTELAAKLASLFASEGTVSALASIAQSGNTKDRTVATEAMAKAFGNMAQRSLDENNVDDAESYLQRAIRLREQVDGVNSVELCDHLDRLAELYMTQGKLAQAEPLLKRSLKLRELNGQPSSPDSIKSANRLAGLLEERGNLKAAASETPPAESGKSSELNSGDKTKVEDFSEPSGKSPRACEDKPKSGDVSNNKNSLPDNEPLEAGDTIKDKHSGSTVGSAPVMLR